MTIRTLLAFIMIPILFFGCKTVVPREPVTIDHNPIKVQIDLVKVVDDKVKVILDVSNSPNDYTDYFIPKIVPGTYQNNDYGRFIEDFIALDSNNNPLKVIKEGKNHWKIENARQLKTISYWVNDTYDIEDTHQIFSPTGSNIKKNDNFILNLYAFIGYFKNLEEKKYEVAIIHPTELEASTSLTLSKDINKPSGYKKYPKAGTDIFDFKRYSELVDSPIMYTVPNSVTFTVQDIEVLLSIYSPNNSIKAKLLLPQMERMIRAQKNFLGNINTTKKYSILLYLSSSRKDARGFGALEHHTSTLVVLPESLSLKKMEEYLINTVSHEFFHIVTPIQIHSKEIHNFEYNQPKMSAHLWLYEGTPEYFSLLFQIREALISKEDFFDGILAKINASKAFDDTLSFTEMSTNILKESYRKNYLNVYEKGALISMCLDIIIREQSDGKKGLLDLIKDLSKKFGNDIPFEDNGLISEIDSLLYPGVADFLQKHVVGTIPIDYHQYLKKTGLIFATKNVPSSYFVHEKKPFIKGSEITNEVIFTESTKYSTFLTALGVQEGDVLLKINTKAYSIKNIYDLFSDTNTWKNGDTVTFLVKRNEQELTLQTTVAAPRFSKMILKQDPEASEKQVAILKKWIND